MDDQTPHPAQSQSQSQSQGSSPGPFDEMTVDGTDLRPPYAEWKRWFDREDAARLAAKGAEAETLFRRTGITFAVYGQEEAAERLIPFDMVPRVISAAEWERLERGIAQRVRAINLFLHDVYHDARCISDGIVPEALIRDNAAFCPPMVGVDPPGGVYTHIVGTDIVRTGEGEFYVLEDNARIPSGVSYMLENRETMMRMFPELFAAAHVRPVEDYPAALRRSLAKVAPPAHGGGQVSVAVLTPGVHNSAYFEHSFLADQMGVPLVEASDLTVRGGRVVMRTTMGFEAVDVLYRRVDDAFLDPLTFDPDSLLGVPGIMDVYRAGGITIANAPGTGIADDKAVYAYMPDIVRYFTGEDAILPNVPTHRCDDPDVCADVLGRLDELVVKEVHGSGGYGMLVGPTASPEERAAFAEVLRSNPAGYIAQPTLALSTVPILTAGGLSPRHVDLRPFVLVSDEIRMMPGGLTRVALTEGSLVVNSSQGGGTKDTWVLAQ